MGTVQRVDVVFDIYSDERKSIKSFEHTKRQMNIGPEVRILNGQTRIPPQFNNYLHNVQNKKNISQYLGKRLIEIAMKKLPRWL